MFFMRNNFECNFLNRTKSLQTPANVLVLNLAIADLLMMLSQGPFFIVNVLRSKWWSFGVLSCEIYGFTGGVFGVVAIMTMAAIGNTTQRETSPQ